MRRAALLAATLVLLAGPTVLAFLTGGYFDGPRFGALAAAWLIVLLLALAGPVPLPRSKAGGVAVGALAALGAWTAISLTWAPLDDPAFDAVSRLLLYLGALLAAIALLRDRRAARAVEPALALGATTVIGYALAGRLLPGLIDLVEPRSFKAGGRLEQPITYWNAEGLLAGVGFLLSVRIAGDPTRPRAMRAAAAAACLPLGAGVYLSYSRGALAVTVLGLIVLLTLSPSWAQLRAAALAVVGAVVVSATAAALPGVASLEGSAGQQERDGAVMLVVLAVAMAAVVTLALRTIRGEARGGSRNGTLGFARHLPAVAAGATALCIAGLVAGGLRESGGRTEPAAATAARFSSLESVRFEYWQVGLKAFADHPLQGLGAGGFRVFWRQERDVNQGVREVHSLELEMASELGLPGLALLLTFLGAVALAARRALKLGAPLAPGACAALSAWVLHASVDWDWQLPAVTLPAIVLTGGLLAAIERDHTREPERDAAPRVASATAQPEEHAPPERVPVPSAS